MGKSKKENKDEMSEETAKKDAEMPVDPEMLSDESTTEEVIEEGNENPKNEENEGPVDEVSQLKAEKEELNEKFLRLYSEFDNFRRRTQKEKLELYKTAGEDVLSSMLPVLDNLDRAMKSIDEATEVEGVKQGIELISQDLYKTLNQKGLKAMESPVGKEFDVDTQEAITRVPAPEKKLKGKVIDEIEKGYMLHDKVIRYAKVVIGE